VPDHTPETLKFYVPGDADDIVFSQYRSRIHFASDEAVLAALSTAEEKLDIFEVNFTLEFACEAGIVFVGICDYENHALPFMRMIMEQVETNQIPVRILVEEDAMDGMENKVAIQAFVAELEKRGLSEYVDIHFYNGKMHAKGFIVDDKFLVVGSQNFQYSSWGDKALNEYNLSTENAEAIDTYKNAFEFYWADSTSAAEVMALYPEGD
jgi:phosphatidylserine/phosphatidylglycerophosphate/cardiolipin synthase-like enzyme